jgi:hypothetical protein
VNNAAIKKGNGMILIHSRNINRESVNFKGSVIETVLITRMLERRSSSLTPREFHVNIKFPRGVLEMIKPLEARRRY